ncbi:MAG: hypothetical protein JRF18_05210 [Deltaproteobacteria bacterium]|nr:hypothetical protein [Deltaproteobacteria bacterium]
MPTEFLHKNMKGNRSVVHHPALFVIFVLLMCWCASGVSSAWGCPLLPHGPEIPGWQMTDKPYHYNPEDLYKYINGEAESFLAYGFVSLKGVNYSTESESKDTITVDIYNMGEKLNAFGMFQSKRGSESSSSKIGAASYGTNGYLAFYKGRRYVEILSFVKSEQWKEQHLVIARKVADKMKGDALPPHELSYLPESGKVDGSEQYIKGGILGHAFLDRGLVSEHRVGGDVVSTFVALFPSKEDAAHSFEAHKDFLQKGGKKCLPIDGIGQRGFSSQEPYHKNILVAQEGPFVIGVYDLPEAQQGMDLLKDMAKRVKPAQ